MHDSEHENCFGFDMQKVCQFGFNAHMWILLTLELTLINFALISMSWIPCIAFGHMGLVWMVLEGILRV